MSLLHSQSTANRSIGDQLSSQSRSVRPTRSEIPRDSECSSRHSSSGHSHSTSSSVSSSATRSLASESSLVDAATPCSVLSDRSNGTFRELDQKAHAYRAEQWEAEGGDLQSAAYGDFLASDNKQRLSRETLEWQAKQYRKEQEKQQKIFCEDHEAWHVMTGRKFGEWGHTPRAEIERAASKLSKERLQLRKKAFADWQEADRERKRSERAGKDASASRSGSSRR